MAGEVERSLQSFVLDAKGREGESRAGSDFSGGVQASKRSASRDGSRRSGGRGERRGDFGTDSSTFHPVQGVLLSPTDSVAGRVTASTFLPRGAPSPLVRERGTGREVKVGSGGTKRAEGKKGRAERSEKGKDVVGVARGWKVKGTDDILPPSVDLDA